MTGVQSLRELLLDLRFYLSRQYIRFGDGRVVCMLDLLNPALLERVDRLAGCNCRAFNWFVPCPIGHTYKPKGDPCPKCGDDLVGGAGGSGVKCPSCPYWFCW